MYLHSNEILSCQLLARTLLCKINMPFYPTDNTHHCSYYLLQNDDEKVRQFCFTVSNESNYMHQAVSLDHYYWAITTMKPSKLQVVCLTSSYYIKLKLSIDIIYIPDACEAYTNTVLLNSKE